MTVQEIEAALLRQLPIKKQHLPNNGVLTKEFSPENILVIICGLASIYLPSPRNKIVEYFDVNNKTYDRYVNQFFTNLKRVNEVVRSYGVFSSRYKDFSDAFWDHHNTKGERGKSGLILSHILSSKREFREFVKEDNIFTESDFSAFFIYNKAQLTMNYLNLYSKEKKFFDFLDYAF